MGYLALWWMMFGLVVCVFCSRVGGMDSPRLCDRVNYSCGTHGGNAKVMGAGRTHKNNKCVWIMKFSGSLVFLWWMFQVQFPFLNVVVCVCWMFLFVVYGRTLNILNQELLHEWFVWMREFGARIFSVTKKWRARHSLRMYDKNGEEYVALVLLYGFLCSMELWRHFCFPLDGRVWGEGWRCRRGSCECGVLRLQTLLPFGCFSLALSCYAQVYFVCECVFIE